MSTLGFGTQVSLILTTIKILDN